MPSTPPRRVVVAIDGPAGSGKSTTARAVAAALGYAHLDSGALYRAVTLVALAGAGEPAGWRGAALAALARERGVGLRRRAPRRGGGRAEAGPAAYEVTIGRRGAGEELRSEPVTRHVSAVAAMPEVRDFVNARLRAAARTGGVVLDGRDIGTAVFPDAAVKVFMVADAGERARRRLLERGRAPDAGAVADEAGALVRRDERDSSRATAPLARAGDAVLVDTTALAFEEQVRRIVELVRARVQSLDPARGRG